MSRRDNMKRIFVGNLPPDVRTKDLENLFYKYGRINFIDLKTRRGPPFAFVEFEDYRDAEDAVRNRDGRDFDGFRLRVEFPRGRERPSRFKNGSGPGRSNAPQRRSKFRVRVTGLPSSGSWQDLKDHMREVGEVCYADVYKGGEGVVEFINYEDMRYAIKKLNNTKFKSHEGESSYIKLREETQSGDSRSRSRSPVARGRRSPSYSPARRRGSSQSRSPSRSPKAKRSSGHKQRPSKRGRSYSRSRSPSRSKSYSRSRSRSRSSSGSRHSDKGSSHGSRDRSRSRSKSRTPSHYGDKSPSHVDKRASSNSRSPSPAGNQMRRSTSKDNNNKDSRSRSHSKSASRSVEDDRSPAGPQRTPSKTPSRTPTPNREGSPSSNQA